MLPSAIKHLKNNTHSWGTLSTKFKSLESSKKKNLNTEIIYKPTVEFRTQLSIWVLKYFINSHCYSNGRM